MKPLIVLDFDDTLINTAKLKRDVFKVAVRHGVSRKAALLAYTKARTWPFTTEKFAGVLWENPEERKAAVRSLDALFKKPRAYNFAGVEQFLKTLSASSRIILVTYGTKALQESKITQSGLRRFFPRIIFTDDASKEKILRTLRKATKGPMVLVDDSLTVCAVGEELGIPTIRVKKTPKSSAYYTALAKRISTIASR